MDDAVDRARERIEGAAEGRPDAAAVDAALERAREQVEALAAATAEIESSLPARVGDAVQDGLREQVLPVARNLAEIRGLMNQVIRRLERVEGDLLSERHARVVRQWRGNREVKASAALLAPLDPHLQPGVERLPHPAGQQGHLAQQPDDFPLAGQGQLFPDAGRVGSGGAQLGQQVDLGSAGIAGVAQCDPLSHR